MEGTKSMIRAMCYRSCLTDCFRSILPVAVVILVICVAEAGAKEFFVSPNASPEGTGKKKNPWSLQIAFSQPKKVKPGDTIWLRGGTYRGSFVSTLRGTAELPIRVRQFSGERATIDGDGTTSDILTIQGSYTYYQDFEVMNS